ncbi:MAG: hypothetical protein OXG58_02705 [Gemmatimonadetes bacterium]|nr:hypothetical protein [Gemmatimonadota bacterium]MCY3942240.1 hypothetical protein [Gemmatimonadota bacterium]
MKPRARVAAVERGKDRHSARRFSPSRHLGAGPVDGVDSEAEILKEAIGRTEGLQPWRRATHMASGVGIAAAVHLVGLDSAVPVVGLACAAAMAVALDVVRLRSAALNTVFYRWFRALASPREARRPVSSTWYLIGALATVAIAPPSWSVPAILVLAVADPVASVVGRLWGRRPLGKGSWEGSAAFYAVSVAVLIPFFGLPVALAAGTFAAAAEVAPTGIDDNLTVPLATLLALWVVGAPV